MNQSLLITCILLLLTGNLVAQDFITRGKIEYEIKVNNKRKYTDAQRAKSPWLASQPEYDISYRELVFAGNRSLYIRGRKAMPSINANDNSLYTDLDSRKMVARESFLDEPYLYEDSVRPIKWKIENEIRKIAGLDCRKAIGIIHDSVYVVAFYCPEIVPQGGPEFFTGLPGMILGLAIPRYFTTWFATKIELASLDESSIAPPAVKKSKLYTKKELTTILSNKYKEAGFWKNKELNKATEELNNYTF
jgi:GLPGLI family protein